jgi:2-dehydropantoate 2-reductase
MLTAPLRICVVGAGAIGGYLAGKLALAGHEVSIVARGEHLAAIRSRGLTLADRNGHRAVARLAHASDSLSAANSQDYLILAVKSHQLPNIAQELSGCYGDSTTVVTLQNGIPWWYFHGHGGPHEGRQLTSVDPDGRLSRYIPAQRVIGAVVHKAACLAEPGVVLHTDVPGDSFPLGELDGRSTDRIRTISDALQGAGIEAPVVDRIRDEKWYKLWGNMVFNPVCALTHANCEEVFACEETHRLGLVLMEEARAVAEKLGVRFRATPSDRMDRTRSIGPIQPSMLQDTEAGRQLEVEAMLGAIVELGRLTQTDMPHVQAIYACTKLLASVIAHRRVQIVPQRLAHAG